MTRKTAEMLRRLIEKAAVNLTDQEASEGPELFPRLKENESLISSGTRINWNGTVKRAAVDLLDTAENNPDNAPSLWEDIDYKNGYRIIPDTITAGLAFSLNEYGYRGDLLYKSLIDANVWTPEQNPTGWELISE